VDEWSFKNGKGSLMEGNGGYTLGFGHTSELQNGVWLSVQAEVGKKEEGEEGKKADRLDFRIWKLGVPL
jgi:hypothetical protein